jgi:hypothetical protein
MVVGIYLLMYLFCFAKGMDMLLFPYNAMFAGAPSQKPDHHLYVVEWNDWPVLFTHYPYWKKDQLEQAPVHYARYVEHGEKVYMDAYLLQKKWPLSVKQFLNKRLTPGKIDFETWSAWYLNLIDIPCSKNDQVRLLKLSVRFKDGYPIYQDTTVICSTIFH